MQVVKECSIYIYIAVDILGSLYNLTVFTRLHSHQLLEL